MSAAQVREFLEQEAASQPAETESAKLHRCTTKSYEGDVLRGGRKTGHVVPEERVSLNVDAIMV